MSILGKACAGGLTAVVVGLVACSFVNAPADAVGPEGTGAGGAGTGVAGATTTTTTTTAPTSTTTTSTTGAGGGGPTGGGGSGGVGGNPSSECGDGQVDGPEGCDDGATLPGDGCDATCQVEVGYSCVGEPSLCCGSGLLPCAGDCVDTQVDFYHCGSCNDPCDPGQVCQAGGCLTVCDDFSIANTTAIPGWTERVGDFFVDGGRLMTTASGGAYTNHVTMDGSLQTDGCATARAIYGSGSGVRAAGIIARWTNNTGYVVGVIQDNGGTADWDSLWLYEYPNQVQLAGSTGLSLGQDATIRLELVGASVTIRADAERDGVYDQSLTANTTLSAGGLTGAMALAAGSSSPFIDEFCWQCP